MKEWKWTLGLLALLMLCASAAGAAGIREVNLQIGRVALFKNGLGYVHSGALLPATAEDIRFGQLPVPCLGTFWVSYSRNLDVGALVTGMEDAGESQLTADFARLLADNIGGRAIIFLSGGNATGTDARLEGTLLSISPTEGMQEPANPYVMGVRATGNPGYNLNYGVNNSMVCLKMDNGAVTVFNSNLIRRLELPDAASARLTGRRTVKRPSLRMELRKPAGNNERVSVSYLARGLSWSPSYMIDLSDDRTARFTAKALVINELADLQSIQLELVTGFPNIGFANINSPIAMGQSLAEFLNALQRGGNVKGERGVMTQRVIMSNSYVREADLDYAMPSYAAAADGSSAEDLFFYPVKDFSLRRGETVYLPLFTAEVPYEHIYIWKIPDFLDSQEYYRPQPQQTKAPAEEIWHCCRLTNTMKIPWTTAPAQFISEGRFVGQDTCYYTASGRQSTININKALEMQAEQAEFEVTRKRQAASFYGSYFDLVGVRGELKVRNGLGKDVRLEVTKEISGELQATQPEARSVTTAKGLKRVNPGNVLTWTLEMKNGEERTLTYSYDVYVRG